MLIAFIRISQPLSELYNKLEMLRMACSCYFF